MKSNPTTLLLLLVCLFFSAACTGSKEKKHHHKEGRTEEVTTLSDNAQDRSGQSADETITADCDTALWKYVYNPDRLEVIERCKTVTGVIEESNPDPDGDQHMLLRLDSGQGKLLTKKNKTKKQGDLVIEAVCVNKVKLKKVGSTCEGYINRIQLPRIGDHVRVTGSFVNDTHNGWTEIHPIMKLEKIR